MSTWSLKDFYNGFDDPKFLSDFNALDDLTSQVISLSDEITSDFSNPKEKLEKYLVFCKESSLKIELLRNFVFLTISTDSSNVSANKYNASMQQKLSLLTEPRSKIEIWIGKLENIDDIINSSELLTEHKFFINEILRVQKYMLSAKEESIIAQLKNTGSKAWLIYKNSLISNHKVTFKVNGEEKTMPLTEALNYSHSSNSEERKTAYFAEIASYKQIEEGVCASLNAIKGEVLTITKMRGYNEPIEMTLQHSRLQKETLDAMLSAIRDALPMFRSYIKRKSEILGYKNGLAWYDMYAPVVEKSIPYSYEDGQKFVLKHFASFSDNLYDLAKTAFDNNWIDVYPKAGKVGGAFCSSTKLLKQSRVLLNYGNTFGDVSTLAHELGHAFHGYCLNNESDLNKQYTMPVAETASILCETIVKEACMKESTDEEKLAILEAEISGCSQVIVDIYSRYLFEGYFFEKRKEGYVSVEETKELMIKAQKEAYGDALDPDCLHPYMWTWKPHYYNAENNFYNFPYSFGLLFAKGLYAKYQEDTVGFPAKYEELLALTGKMCIEDIGSSINIDLSQKEFWQSSLGIITNNIQEFLNLTSK